MEKSTEERRRKTQADRRSAPSPCLDWNCQKEMKAVRLQGSNPIEQRKLSEQLVNNYMIAKGGYLRKEKLSQCGVRWKR